MSRLLSHEKQRQVLARAIPDVFPAATRGDGIYKGRPRPFCLPAEHAEYNLFAGIRQPALAYFSDYEIRWHDGRDGRPSNHLCDSQVCCVNFLFPFFGQPEALATLLRPVFPGLRRILPFEKEGQYLAFEWIGEQNYLGERVRTNGRRTRGANFTSADAAVRFECEDGTTQIVLIEWKYTESYASTSLVTSGRGTDRTSIYRHLFLKDDFPLDKALLPDFAALFYEPFYQLFRQQCLAHEMERAGERGAQRASLLHIAPRCNSDVLRVTSSRLERLGPDVCAVWKRLVQPEDRFQSVATEDLFWGFPVSRFPQLASWWAYVRKRYSWVWHMVTVRAQETSNAQHR